jgi:sugar lactone lactonase YvrE
MAFDVNTGNIWITAIDDNLAEVFNVTNTASGVAIAAAAPIQITGLGTEVAAPATKTACGTISVAIDSTSHAWILTAGGTASNCGSLTSAALNTVPANTTGGAAGTSIPVTNAGLNAPNQVVIDGNGNVFLANTGASAIAEYSPAAVAFVTPSTGGLIPSATGTLYQPNYMAVDRAGALWTLSSGNGSTHPANLMQILGVAAPTDPVLADGKYGVKP